MTAEVIATPIDALSEDEFRLYKAHEGVIAKGLKVFEEVGEALLDIRDKRLYREEYPSFENYCRERWSMSRRHADRLILASDVADDLRPFGLMMTNEAQARELALLPPQFRPVAWKMAVETHGTDSPPAAHVRSTVNVFKIAVVTGAIDDGTGEDIPIEQAQPEHLKAAVTEETYERQKRQQAYIAGSIPQCIHEGIAEMTPDGLEFEPLPKLDKNKKYKVKFYEMP